MNVANYKWKYKTEYGIWYMQIPNGLFAKWDKHTSVRLVNKGFEPTTQDDIRKFIVTVYIKGILIVKGEIRYLLSEHGRWGVLLHPTLDVIVLEGIDIFK